MDQKIKQKRNCRKEIFKWHQSTNHRIITSRWRPRPRATSRRARPHLGRSLENSTLLSTARTGEILPSVLKSSSKTRACRMSKKAISRVKE
jgi:hypothetical protein